MPMARMSPDDPYKNKGGPHGLGKLIAGYLMLCPVS